MQDIAGLTPTPPRFAPRIGDLATPMKDIFAEYARRISKKEYPAAEQQYELPADERSKFLRKQYEAEQAKRRQPEISGPW